MNLKKISLIVLGILGLIAVVYIEYPIAKVYLDSPRPLGGDMVHYMYYVDYFRNNHAIPPMGWKAQQFEGMPQVLDYAWLHFYLIQPLVSLVGIITAVKIYPIIYQFIFVIGSYLLFWKISKKPILSSFLTIGLIRCSAVYIPLYNSGVVVSSISQSFLPLTLLFLVYFFENHNKKYLVLSALVTAFSLYTHVTGVLFVLIPSTILLLFYPGKFIQKIKTIITYELIVFSLGAIAFFPQFTDRIFYGGYAAIGMNFYPDIELFRNLITSVNPYILIAFAIAFILFLPLRIKHINNLFLPFIFIFFYYLLFMTGLWLGFNPFAGFIFPHRVFWILPLLIGCIVSIIFSSKEAIQTRFSKVYEMAVIGAICVVLAINLTIPFQKIFDFISQGELQLALNPPADSARSLEDLYKYYVDDDFLSLMRDDEVGKYRFYTLEAVPNSVYAIIYPQIVQARGDFHYLNKETANWFAWMDAVLAKATYVKQSIYPQVADMQSRFIIDWYAIKYLMSSKVDVGEVARQYLDPTNPCVYWVSPQTTTEEVALVTDCTSPIVRPTSVPAIGFIGSDYAYDIFLRNLGIINYNSKYLIPIKAGKYIEDIEEKDLENYDGLILYDYTKKGGETEYLDSWRKIEEFARSGGKVFIETGSSSPEKYATALPTIFPMEKLYTGSLGTSWQVEVPGSIFKEIDFGQFAPLTYEGGDWTVSYTNTADIKTGSKILLDLSGKPVVASQSIGNGEVIWSGLNLLYRPVYLKEKAVTESKLFEDIMSWEFGISYEDPLKFSFENPNQRVFNISASQGKGVIFKENNYGGWRAEVNDRDLNIYNAALDFMYVRLPKELWNKPFNLTISYQGLCSNWIYFAVSIVSLLFVLEYLVMRNYISKKIISITRINRLVSGIFVKIKKIGFWWNRE